MTKLELIDKIRAVLGMSAADLDIDGSLGLTGGWDSLAHVEIMMILEAEFLIEITNDTIDYYSSIERILELVE